jgi:hypothetical protein
VTTTSHTSLPSRRGRITPVHAGAGILTICGITFRRAAQADLGPVSCKRCQRVLRAPQRKERL